MYDENIKLCRYKLLKIVVCFCIDIDATKIYRLLKINRNPINRYSTSSANGLPLTNSLKKSNL